MKMAKASKADLQLGLDVTRMLEDLVRGEMPSPTVDASAPLEWFDIDDPAQCRRALQMLLAAARTGSLYRVTFGMTVLLDPRNELVDPAADTLQRHPKSVAALAAQHGGAIHG